jgi:hypothetical protein
MKMVSNKLSLNASTLIRRVIIHQSTKMISNDTIVAQTNTKNYINYGVGSLVEISDHLLLKLNSIGSWLRILSSINFELPFLYTTKFIIFHISLDISSLSSWHLTPHSWRSTPSITLQIQVLKPHDLHLTWKLCAHLADRNGFPWRSYAVETIIKGSLLLLIVLWLSLF